jgi:hypothetical protein
MHFQQPESDTWREVQEFKHIPLIVLSSLYTGLVLHPEDVPVLPYISNILQISALPAHSIFTIIWLLTMTLKGAGL